MWKTKIRLKHRCLFGDNCEKSKVTCVNMSFNAFKMDRQYYVYHFGTVFGENSEEFFRLLRKDKRVDHIEVEGNTFLVVERRSEKDTPGMYITPEIIYIKPVYVDREGYETWELAAIQKESLMRFINRFEKAEILNIEKTKLKDLYLLRLSPDLSPHQRDALELAKEEGYYRFPKKTDLNKLARMSKLSKSAFREHLKRAEMKILGSEF